MARRTFRQRRSLLWSALAILGLVALPPSLEAAEAFAASARALDVDRQIDWRQAKLLVVQADGRYKTLDSFARESLVSLYGREHFPGLTPLASLFELMFNREAYIDTPIVRIRDTGLRVHFSERMRDADRQRVRGSGYMTPREMASQDVRERIRELEPRREMIKAIGRVRDAEEVAFFLNELIRIVPRPEAAGDAAWYTPWELRTNAALALPEKDRPSVDELARRFGAPADGLSPEQAAAVVDPWLGLERAWQAGETARVQASLASLADVLPTLARTGVYPQASQRRAEALYYAMGKFTWGWVLYVIGALIGVLGLVTRWRWPWVTSLILLVGALGIHAFGLTLRWYILGRIPVANMFEAITASAWVGIALALVVELVYRSRVFVLAAHATGFFALVVAGYVIPQMTSDGGALVPMMGILDNVMLRIHTVLIIASYALIFLAAVIAVVYLCGYVWHRLHVTEMAPSAMPAVAMAGGGTGFLGHRPILAGAMPGDECRGANLPRWLNDVDWSHLIILNLAFILLFVGIILGAVWADYSWGRPWGWDPKETFALNTWLIYAVLIHARFIFRRKGLWTAWLSVAGCAMMAFNWFFVNFYITGLHSYA